MHLATTDRLVDVVVNPQELAMLPSLKLDHMIGFSMDAGTKASTWPKPTCFDEHNTAAGVVIKRWITHG
jgi:hypothetical protein